MTAGRRIVTVGLATLAALAGSERRPFDPDAGSAVLPAPFVTLAAQSTAPVAELVADIRPGLDASAPHNFVVFQNALYFSANDGVHGRELWRLGTSGPPTLVADLEPLAGSSLPTQLTAVGDSLYFVASTSVDGRELWQYDGVNAPALISIRPGPASAFPEELTPLGNDLVFTADDGTGEELFAFGPTGLRTFDIYPNVPSCFPEFGGCGSTPYGLTVYDGTLYFAAAEEVNGGELYEFDGTSVRRLTQIVAGSGSAAPGFFTGVGRYLVFAAYNASGWNQLYSYNIDTETWEEIATGDAGFGAFPSHFTTFGTRAYFSADGFTIGRELWTTDGTAAGTWLVKDILPGPGGSDPHNYAVFNGELYFDATDPDVGREIHATDGSTVRVLADLNAPPGETYWDAPTPFGPVMVFTPEGTPALNNPWYTTGTALGTAPVLKSDGTLIRANGGVDGTDYVPFNGALYFAANDAATANNYELWRITLSASTATTTTLQSSLNPSMVGDPVTFTATVTGASPTGTVTFLDGTTPLGDVPLSSGIALLDISTLGAGSHTITARYNGDTDDAPSTSTDLIQVVDKIQTTTSLISSLNPSVYTQSVTFTATVAPVSGSITPTGDVTFFDGPTGLATVALVGNTATLQISTLNGGTHAITASYAGSVSHEPSTSNAVQQTVTQLPTTTTLISSPDPSTVNETVTFSAAVTGALPTGLVTFSESGVPLGTVPVIASAAGNVATFQTSSLSIGLHLITATYDGDTNHSGSTAGDNHTVNDVVPPTPPVADSQNISVSEDTPTVITLTGSDVNNDPLTFIDLTAPTHGTLTGTPPSVTYTPSLNYNGLDSFSFKVNDGTADSNAAIISITVLPVNDAPVATGDSYVTPEDTTLLVPAPGILANDTDVDGALLVPTLVAAPLHGTLTLNGDGSLTYVPPANFSGADGFTYRVSDGALDSNVATVSIAVMPVNDPPIASNDSYTTTENMALTVAAPGVLSNDTDVEASPLTAVLEAGPVNGTLTLNANGSFTYTPTGSFAGSDGFSYRASDGASPSNVATVTISVVPKAFTWTATGNLSTRRRQHSATVLLNGKVLVAGGRGQGNAVESSAELYDPVTGLWMATGSMRAKRAYHTATLLPNGHVLVVGGENNVLLNSAEIYDPATASWTAAGTLLAFHSRHSATLLPSGKVLVAGGYDNSGPYAGAELYDPLTRTSSATASMLLGRNLHAAVLLPNGKVLVAAGYSTDAGATNRAEIYDPASGTWSEVASLATRRSTHTTTLLATGKVLVTGGGNNTDAALATAEIYDPATDTWTAAGSMSTPRIWHSAIQLPSGRVLVAGGNLNNTSNSALTSADVYDPVTGQWSSTASLLAARRAYTLTLLNDGRVLAAAGSGVNGTLATAEVYGPVIGPSLGTWAPTASLAVPRTGHTETLLADGRVLVTGGTSDGIAVSSTEIFDSATGTWTSSGSLNAARAFHIAVLLPDGKVLVAGGFGGGALVPTAEIYDPVTGTWTDTGSPNVARSVATATLLPGDRGVLLAGGTTATGDFASSAEIFNLTTRTWSSAGSFSGGRSGHRATPLSDGRVLLTGGFTTGGNPYLSSAVIYDPATFTWSNVANMAFRRGSHSATLLRDGRVLVAGGVNKFGSLDTAEIFDPVSGTWTQTTLMKTSRVVHSATLLSNGKVLVAGGTQSGGIVLPTAELFDPAAGTWTTMRSLTMPRSSHTATLLTNGTVLAVGGNTSNIVTIGTAEIYTP